MAVATAVTARAGPTLAANGPPGSPGAWELMGICEVGYVPNSEIQGNELFVHPHGAFGAHLLGFLREVVEVTSKK